jgi:hypothetical protein
MEAILLCRKGADTIVAVTHGKAPSGIINALAEEYCKRSVPASESLKQGRRKKINLLVITPSSTHPMPGFSFGHFSS